MVYHCSPQLDVMMSCRLAASHCVSPIEADLLTVSAGTIMLQLDRSNSKLIAEKTNRAGTATCQAVNPHVLRHQSVMCTINTDRGMQKSKDETFREGLRETAMQIF
uniref:Uncharacterized protein n=1 Tax=Parascaris equorum TaxID=6256 RepID=A0A914RXY6_PAREQ